MSQTQSEAAEQLSPEDIREKILHILRIYPKLSPSMLHQGLGVWMRAGLWRPVLDQLIEDGEVVREQESRMTPQERYNTYTWLRLATLEQVVFTDE